MRIAALPHILALSVTLCALTLGASACDERALIVREDSTPEPPTDVRSDIVDTRGADVVDTSLERDWLDATWCGQRCPAVTARRYAAGGWLTCALGDDDAMTCWGANEGGQAGRHAERNGPFTSVAACREASCAVRPSGEISCWGSAFGPDGYGAWAADAVVVDVATQRASSNTSTVCAVTRSGAAGCWGPTGEHFFDFPDGVAYVDVSTGPQQACALRADGSAHCWRYGARDGDELVAPHELVSLSVGDRQACGLRPDHTLVCWGEGASPPPGGFQAVSMGLEHGCALGDDGALACWGEASMRRLDAPRGGVLASLSVGAGHACAVPSTHDGLVCWGSDRAGEAHVPIGARYEAVDAGWYFDCAQSGQELHCWGKDEVGGLEVLSTPDFRQLSLGVGHGCVLAASGELTCFGWNNAGESTPPPGVAFTQIAAGGYHTCGLDLDGRAHCWGSDSAGQSTPPADTFATLAAGSFHTCGLRPDGSAVCWGMDTAGQSTAPNGLFTAIDGGAEHTCALDPEGRAVCWGSAPSIPTTERFTQIAAGNGRTCGLRADATTDCWERGASTPIAGLAMSHIEVLDADYDQVCGLHTDQLVECVGVRARPGSLDSFAP